MNKLALPGRVWIASDIHIGPASPLTAAAFYQFLELAAQQADALLLAGDVFDAWIGDDVALLSPEPWLQEALARLQGAAARIPVWLGPGNRDFLMGAQLARHVGARLLPESVLLQTDAGPLLLAHGDEFCTADTRYQRFRRVVRRPAVQNAFLALPLRLRRGIAMWARRRSMQSNQYKSAEIMDVEPQAVAAALRHSGARTLIHGHTHRPGRHPVNVDGRACERIVLPDWDFDHAASPRGGWLSIGPEGILLNDYPSQVTRTQQYPRA